MRTLIQVMIERDQKLEDYLEAKEVYGKGTPECMDAYYRWERLSDEYDKLVKEGQTMKETKAVVKARINPIVKAKALEILESLDLTTNKVIADLFEFIAETETSRSLLMWRTTRNRLKMKRMKYLRL